MSDVEVLCKALSSYGSALACLREAKNTSDPELAKVWSQAARMAAAEARRMATHGGSKAALKLGRRAKLLGRLAGAAGKLGRLGLYGGVVAGSWDYGRRLASR
jgi:hypothetical protein